jgi:hypothetical protein
MGNVNALVWPILLVLIALPSVPRMSAQVDVLTERYDNARSGANLKETTLTPNNVNRDHFGKLAFRIVDGNIYAQPLIVSQAKVAGRAANIAIIATEHNSVYAFDAEDTAAEPGGQESAKALWHTGPAVLGTHMESQDLSKKFGVSCVDITTEVGITSTPVIQLTKTSSPKEGLIFVVAKSKNGKNAVQKLFTLSMADGTKVSETVISGDVKVPGSGAKVTFDPFLQLNRPALLLQGSTLYIAFGGHCDQSNYHGWVFAYDVSNPMAPKRVAVFADTLTPRGANDKKGRAGIWMSGQGPAVDDAGNIYLATGDGSNNGRTDFGNSVLNIKLAAGGIQVTDWFTPRKGAAFDADRLTTFDADLGSGGAVPLPNSHLLLAGGKEGRMFLIDRNDMGHGAKPALHDFQVTNTPFNKVATPTAAGDIFFWNIHGSPVIWRRPGQMFAYLMGEEDHLKQYKLIPDTGPGGAGWKFESDTPFHTSKESAPLPNPPNGLPNTPNRGDIVMPGGFLSISADGNKDGTGIVWATMPFADNANLNVVRGVLRAFDASDVSNNANGQLWSSEDENIPADGLGMFAKFCPPTVANGKVYVATFQQERVDNGVHEKMPGGNLPALAIYGPKN